MFADTSTMTITADAAASWAHRSDWHLLTHDRVAGALARIYQVINHAHLFREATAERERPTWRSWPPRPA